MCNKSAINQSPVSLVKDLVAKTQLFIVIL